MSTNIQKFASRELSLLESIEPENLITPFKKEILALCEAFSNSGQSGGSAPYTASAISKAINDLLLFEPISPITGYDEEWNDVSDSDSEIIYQNNRCGGLFKVGENGIPYYIDAIVWKGERKYDSFTGTVYIDDIHFEKISSRQNVNFPFVPKTFYIDVVYVPITLEEAKQKDIFYSKTRDGLYYYTVLKNPKQLNKVWKYYSKK